MELLAVALDDEPAVEHAGRRTRRPSNATCSSTSQPEHPRHQPHQRLGARLRAAVDEAQQHSESARQRGEHLAELVRRHQALVQRTVERCDRAPRGGWQRTAWTSASRHRRTQTLHLGTHEWASNGVVPVAMLGAEALSRRSATGGDSIPGRCGRGVTVAEHEDAEQLQQARHVSSAADADRSHEPAAGVALGRSGRGGADQLARRRPRARIGAGSCRPQQLGASRGLVDHPHRAPSGVPPSRTWVSHGSRRLWRSRGRRSQATPPACARRSASSDGVAAEQAWHRVARRWIAASRRMTGCRSPGRFWTADRSVPRPAAPIG